MNRHRQAALALLLAGFGISLVQDATADIFHVSPTGDDSAPGSSDHPWKTLKHAVSRLRAGDTLRLAGGIYGDGAVFSVSGTELAPITIEGGEQTSIDGQSMSQDQPAFQTKGQSHLRFRNLNFRNLRAGVQVDRGSHHVWIEGLHADRCQFAVLLRDASFVWIRRAVADHSRNAFRGEGDTHDVHFENVRAYRSKDIYPGHELKYRNGDGFTFERGSYNLHFKDVVSAEHWDAGFDIKGDHVTLDNVEVYGSTNGLKLWGQDIQVDNALIHSMKAQLRPDGSRVDGNGVHIPSGSARLSNSTISDNETLAIKIHKMAALTLENSVVAKLSPAGKLLRNEGLLEQHGVIWFQGGGRAPSFPESQDGQWADPQFEDWPRADYCLAPRGPAYRDHRQIAGAACRQPR